MNLEYIEDLIDREKINLVDTYLENSAGAYVNYNKLNIIIYDNSKLNSSTKKKETLAEELRSLLLSELLINLILVPN